MVHFGSYQKMWHGVAFSVPGIPQSYTSLEQIEKATKEFHTIHSLADLAKYWEQLKTVSGLHTYFLLPFFDPASQARQRKKPVFMTGLPFLPPNFGVWLYVGS